MPEKKPLDFTFEDRVMLVRMLREIAYEIGVERHDGGVVFKRDRVLRWIDDELTQDPRWVAAHREAVGSTKG